MNIVEMRAILKKQYKGAWKWVNKVNHMQDEQVMAIYIRMHKAGQI